MTERHLAIVRELVDNGGKRPGDHSVWDAYERFKRELSNRFIGMQPHDYEAAIQLYTEKHLSCA